MSNHGKEMTDNLILSKERRAALGDRVDASLEEANASLGAANAMFAERALVWQPRATLNRLSI